MQNKEVMNLIHASFSIATTQQVEGKSKRLLHQNRSRIWVKILAQQFQHQYENDSDLRVFSKHNYSNRKDFGLNELLYDIVVCRVGKVKSAVHKKTLYYVKDVIWQVESEFARDSRQALIDFNKLVLGSAKNKLFIGSQVGDATSFLDVLRPAAKVCQGDVFTSLIPHPRDWNNNSNLIQTWRFGREEWREIN